jgi:A/G-specific adenine glycosylase
MMPCPSRVVPALLKWMESSRRELPWREGREPYAVWVSEIMLQQTKADTVTPFFRRWMLRFPDVHSLAAASPDEVLMAWEGLGYYARARNLHRAAQQVVAQWGGLLPPERRKLLTLPGIGPYTAGAILSLAFGLSEPALDGNSRRVLSRLHDISDDIDQPATERQLWQLGTDLIAHSPPGRAGDLNEALMELGALVCRPRTPDCQACPLLEMCLANSRGVQRERPARSRRPAPPHFDAVAGVIFDGEALLIVQRNADGLLGGLWGFPGGIVRDGRSLADSLAEAISNLVGIHVTVGAHLTSFRHAYTHFSITLHAYCCELRTGAPQPIACHQVLWARPVEVGRLPFPVTDRKILRFLEVTRTPPECKLAAWPGRAFA